MPTRSMPLDPAKFQQDETKARSTRPDMPGRACPAANGIIIVLVPLRERRLDRAEDLWA
jgi:hypothetical protein